LEHHLHVPSVFKKQTITQAAVLISVLALISKFIGFFREVLIANYFGATGQTDAFVVAMLIPGSILGLFAGGFSTLVIPFYLERKSKSEEAARKFVDSALLVWGSVFVVVSVVILIFAPTFVHLIAYGFTGERFELAVRLTRYLVAYGLLNILVAIFTGLLQAQKQFFLPVAVSLIGNVAIVLSLFLLHRYLGINSWAVGLTLSSLISFVAMFLVLYRQGFFHNLSYHGVDWHEIRQFGVLLLPLVISGGISIINQMVDKTIGSSLDAGSIAALNFSGRVWQIPLALFAGPIATAVFPTFSELALTDAGKAQYRSRLEQTMSVSFYVMIPSTFFIFFLSEPIVQLFFERGAFDPKATALTSFVVKMYVLGLFAHAICPIMSKVFYSFKNTTTPVIISAISVGLNIVLNLVLSKFLGAGGIALATSIVMVWSFTLYVILVRKYINPFSKELLIEIGKTLVSAIPIALICYFFLPYFQNASAASLNTFVILAAKIAIVGLLSVAAFMGFSKLLRMQSYEFFRAYLRRTLKRSKQNIDANH